MCSSVSGPDRIPVGRDLAVSGDPGRRWPTVPSDGLDLSPCLEVSPLAKRWARQSLSRYDLPVHESFSGPRRRARTRPDAETPVRIRAVATLATCSSRGRQVVVAEEVTGRVPDLWPCNRSALRPATWLSPLPQTSARSRHSHPRKPGYGRTAPDPPLDHRGGAGASACGVKQL